MGEESLLSVPFDRAVEQAILAMKKGEHLLKCGRRGKLKVCPFRLSHDEKYLIWYSGQEEKQLKLSIVTKIVIGQRNVNVQRQHQPNMEHHSVSLIYAKGEQSLDLFCKDKAQADCWFIGLRAVISRCHASRPLNGLKGSRVAQSCVNSPAGFMRRKHNLGILEDDTDFSQVKSLCGSPSKSVSERCFSDGLSLSSDSLGFLESSRTESQKVVDVLVPYSSYKEPENLKMVGPLHAFSEFEKDASHRFVSAKYGSPQIEKNETLKDVLIWGEGAGGGNIGGLVHRSSNEKEMQVDALLPKVLESTKMLDIQSIALGGKHAVLATKQGEVFCWGDGNGGKLGHKVDMDVTLPKVVESLSGIQVKSVACGEYHTCALTYPGELYVWGDDRENPMKRNLMPRQLSSLLDGISIVSVSCGEWHTAILSSSGRLFTYGNGTFGVLGHGNFHSISQPKEVESLKGLWVKSVACGSWHTAAIVDVIADRFKFNAVGGKIFTWGDGDKGRLGHMDMEKKLVPTCVAQLVNINFVQVSCGRMLTVALTNTGKVYTMGSAVHGQLGNPQAKDRSITIVEGKLKSEFVKDISSGSYHVAALTSRGNVYVWGKGANGQLGLGTSEDKNLPTFVEALRDRQVKSITCGSNLTAAICLHKPISVTDQSACSSCQMPFGFTRKKHNCYNCGRLFCSTCSAKKVTNAPLAPNKSKPYRVCDSCFDHLQKVTGSGRVLRLDNHGQKQLLSPLNMSPDSESVYCGEVTPPRRNIHSARQVHDIEKKRPLGPVSSSSVELPRWGQVSCPIVFQSSCMDNSNSYALTSRCTISSANILEEGFVESNKVLVEEVERLRKQARNLELQCKIRDQEIQECFQALESAWSLAKEEAAKRKAANEIIEALTLRLHALSEENSTREAKDGLRPNLTPIAASYSDNSPALTGRFPTIASTNSPLTVALPKDRKAVDSLSNSPIVFSNTLKSLNGNTLYQEENRSAEDLQVKKMGYLQNGSKASGLEWVEQYESGVYITLTTLPSGQTGLKRVRFSRKRFAQKEAERWWEQNQSVVYQKYNIEGYNKWNQHLTNG